MEMISLGNLSSQEIKGSRVYYIDSLDPVISYLKKGVLYGEQNFKILDQFIINDGLVLDCGGHIGTFALPASKKYNVITIDGSPTNYACLKRTFEGAQNVEVINAILSDSIGQPCDFDDNGPFGHKLDSVNGSMKTSTIDQIVNNRKVCAIKLDIEGSEIEAIDGATDVLRDKPPMIVEINGHCLNFSLKTPQDLLRKIYSVDYIPYINFHGQWVKINPDKKFPFCVADVCCVHKDNLIRYMNLKDREFTDEEISLLFSMNYDRSNEDCRKYFERSK